MGGKALGCSPKAGMAVIDRQCRFFLGGGGFWAALSKHQVSRLCPRRPNFEFFRPHHVSAHFSPAVGCTAAVEKAMETSGHKPYPVENREYRLWMMPQEPRD